MVRTFKRWPPIPVRGRGPRRRHVLAGEDAAAKEVATGLIRDVGFTPVDLGGWAEEPIMEVAALPPVWSTQARTASESPPPSAETRTAARLARELRARPAA